jgi:lipopolysaccharide/colanic/teichoic acid biosynthesis glycosyltransferase
MSTRARDMENAADLNTADIAVSSARSKRPGAGSTVSSLGYRVAKRAIDVVAALVGLVLVWPLFVYCAIRIKLDSRGPVFHLRRVVAADPHLLKDGVALDHDLLRERLRENPPTFNALKFRSMIDGADQYLRGRPDLLREFEQHYKLAEDPRVTPFGQWLRAASLDELPQLVNVLRGQMSIVGPRMISPPELERYEGYEEQLMSVKPGLTGLWQVSGRQMVSYDERVRLDMHYIENRSLLLDIRIMWKTIGTVLGRRGAL